MDQEEASTTRPVRRAGGRTRRYVRGCARTACSPREREGRARYACARELGARGTEAELRRRGGGGRAPLRYRAWGRGWRRRRRALTAPASFPPGPAFLCLPRGGARSICGSEGRGKGRRMETGRDLDPWRRPRSASRRDERRGGWRGEKPGEGLGAPGRGSRDVPGWVKAVFVSEGPATWRVWRGLGSVGHLWDGNLLLDRLWETVAGRVAVQGSPPGANFAAVVVSWALRVEPSSYGDRFASCRSCPLGCWGDCSV